MNLTHPRVMAGPMGWDGHDVFFHGHPVELGPGRLTWQTQRGPNWRTRLSPGLMYAHLKPCPNTLMYGKGTYMYLHWSGFNSQLPVPWSVWDQNATSTAFVSFLSHPRPALQALRHAGRSAQRRNPLVPLPGSAGGTWAPLCTPCEQGSSGDQMH